MKKFRRVGDAVDVPALGLLDVQSGSEIEVADPDLAAGFEGQSGWEPVKSAPVKKAAEKKDEV